MREVITDVLELAGLLLLVLAAAIALARYDVALGVAAGGVGLLLTSALIVAAAARGKRES